MRRGSVGAGVAAGVGALSVIAATVQPANADIQDPDTGLEWQYHEEGEGYYRPPEGGPEAPEGTDEIPTVLVEVGGHREWLDCTQFEPERDCDGLRGRQCVGTEDDGRPELVQIVFTREIDEDDEPTQWQWDSTAPRCTVPPDDDWVPMEEISYEVDETVFQPLGEPNIAINPGERALVNLPTVVSTNYPEGGIEGTGELLSLDPTRIRVPIDIDRPGENLTGELLAEAEYTWSFEEGGTASGRGQPYTPGVDPRTNDDYYVSTTFQTTGIKNVNLDVEWTGEVTVETLAPEPVEPVVVSTSDEVEVRQLQSLLTDS